METRDWVNTIEPRNVRAVMKRVVEDTTSIDVQVVTPLLSLVTVPEDKLLFLRSILQKLKLKLTHTHSPEIKSGSSKFQSVTTASTHPCIAKWELPW